MDQQYKGGKKPARRLVHRVERVANRLGQQAEEWSPWFSIDLVRQKPRAPPGIRSVTSVTYGSLHRSENGCWNGMESAERSLRRMGSLKDVTPARNFFVRFVAQREIEVNDSEWFEVLKRHGMVSTDSESVASSRKSVADASTKLSERTLPYGTPEEDVGERDTFKRRGSIPIVEVLSPFSIYYCLWQYFMMIVDFTYTAFWVPYR